MKKSQKKREIQEEKGDQVLVLSPETKNSIFTVLAFLGAALLLLSLFDKAGIAGEWLKEGVLYLFGNTSFLAPLFLLLGGFSFLFRLKQTQAKMVLAGSVLLVVSVLGTFELIQGEERSAGLLGYVITLPVLSFLSPSAGLFVFAALFFIGILVMFDVSLVNLFSFLPRSLSGEGSESQEAGEVTEWSSTPLATQKRFIRGGEGLKGVKESPEEKETALLQSDGEYEPPPASLLEAEGAGPSAGDIQANKNIIQRTLEEFGIEVEVGEASIGPTVTQYTLKPAQGIHLTRITALSKNLSLALAAHPIRIEAPIPGKALVGIEIPNKQASIVRLRSLLSHLVQKKLPSSLALALGRDVAGEAVIAFLDRMPHLLISGATGSGKSICLNALIITLLYLNSPRTLRLLLIDPKRVELSTYEGIPHLLAPVIVDTKKAISALKWAIAEMERRYELLESVGARDIKGYNDVVKKSKEGKPLPYIIIMIDEMADLMLKFKREVEASIVRIAQMARAVGIHLITSTQRPSTDVVTGLIKANITARIAFKMPTQIDSRTVLDQAGAEKLLGHGDMLFMSGEAHSLKRIQGTYISEREVKRVAEYLKQLGWEEEYESFAPNETEGKGILFDAGFETDDELYEDAKVIALEAGKISASLLQRKLQIGYARAARLLDMMEEEGIIGPTQGAKPREVIKQ